jgi:hypothetical protein
MKPNLNSPRSPFFKGGSYFQLFTKETGRVVNRFSALMKTRGGHGDMDFFTGLE